ncbi:hypothetical protein V4U86_12535 [Mycobacterium sp. AMU20-3851]|uniref:hypothetical protein n=1 Tax=Mycobacterium sp. AMU20-3851 TaxID=3122055 RepID=UPI0037541E2E
MTGDYSHSFLPAVFPIHRIARERHSAPDHFRFAEARDFRRSSDNCSAGTKGDPSTNSARVTGEVA